MPMLWINEMFQVKKPVIAMLHLNALPGDPAYRYTDCMEKVVEDAEKDLKALQDGGVDGILISNEFSLPYERHMSFVTPSAMARVIGEIKKDIRVPFGVDCISDGLATIELAAAVSADFVRGTFCGCYVGDGGLYNNDFSALLRRKSALHLDNLKMFYFLNPESDRNLDTRPLPEIAKSLIFKASPDALCVSASAAGEDVNTQLMDSIRNVIHSNTAIVCNTGCRPDTIVSKLSASDAAIVGTTFKENGDFHAHVDARRVKNFMNIVTDYRASL